MKTVAFHATIQTPYAFKKLPDCQSPHDSIIKQFWMHCDASQYQISIHGSFFPINTKNLLKFKPFYLHSFCK